MSLSHADQIWNRTALEDGADFPRRGDSALAALLQAHGLVMNGGIYQAIECLSADELTAAVEGYNSFGLATVEDVFEAAASGLLSPWTSETELAANKPYSGLVPKDRFLVQAFQDVFRARPHDFSPIAA